MFKFKHFTVNQDRCAMKVGTDGVLLGAWVNVYGDEEYILDIGAGTGVISLMMAQRAEYAEIVGVDIEDVSQAAENAVASPWGDRVSFEQCAIQDFSGEARFDLIVSNPPFFCDSMPCPDSRRTTARHTRSLSFEDLRDSVCRLLSEGGRFAIILPRLEMEQFVAICVGYLYPLRRMDVQPLVGGEVKRVMIEFSTLQVVDIVKSTIAIEKGERHNYTKEYKNLCSDFYLKF